MQDIQFCPMSSIVDSRLETGNVVDKDMKARVKVDGEL